MGPESTIEYYRLLVSGYRERVTDGSSAPIIITSVDVNKVLALAGAPKLEPLVDYLSRGLWQLARAGADVGLLAANTPHIAFAELSKRSPLPLISIVEATRDYAKRFGFKKVGLFGTRSTMQGGFYQDA